MEPPRGSVEGIGAANLAATARKTDGGAVQTDIDPFAGIGLAQHVGGRIVVRIAAGGRINDTVAGDNLAIVSTRYLDITVPDHIDVESMTKFYFPRCRRRGVAVSHGAGIPRCAHHSAPLASPGERRLADTDGRAGP